MDVLCLVRRIGGNSVLYWMIVESVFSVRIMLRVILKIIVRILLRIALEIIVRNEIRLVLHFPPRI